MLLIRIRYLNYSTFRLYCMLEVVFSYCKQFTCKGWYISKCFCKDFFDSIDRIVGYNGNRTAWSPIRSLIIRVINKIGRPRSGSPKEIQHKWRSLQLSQRQTGGQGNNFSGWLKYSIANSLEARLLSLESFKEFKVGQKQENRRTKVRYKLPAPLNNMRTLKFKAQPTNAFFATVNQTFGGSSQLPTIAEHSFVICLNCAQRFDYPVLGSSRNLGLWLSHIFDTFMSTFCWLFSMNCNWKTKMRKWVVFFNQLWVSCSTRRNKWQFFCCRNFFVIVPRATAWSYVIASYNIREKITRFWLAESSVVQV